MIRPSLALATLAAAVSLLASAAQAQSQPQGPPPIRAIPGITAPDSFPNACVDCHTVYPDRNLDVRLSTRLSAWSTSVEPRLLALTKAASPAGFRVEGRHPDAADAVLDIPNGCLECHGRNSDQAPPFARLLHTIHLTGGPENHFLSGFQGECTLCHKLDKASGAWTIPSRPESSPAAGQSNGGPPSSR